LRFQHRVPERRDSASILRLCLSFLEIKQRRMFRGRSCKKHGPSCLDSPWVVSPSPVLAWRQTPTLICKVRLNSGRNFAQFQQRGAAIQQETRPNVPQLSFGFSKDALPKKKRRIRRAVSLETIERKLGIQQVNIVVLVD